MEKTHIVLDTIGKVLKITELEHILHMGLWVGPEGGWSPRERDEMVHYGFIFARFGERILRTETA